MDVSKSKTPAISVVMPVWNGAAYLRDAIESILGQTFTDFEFIILDDGSTDETPEILEQFVKRDSRIRVISLNHEGIVIALNRGVQEARAEWIARMDCDDIAHHDRLYLQFCAVNRDPEIVLCHTQVEYLSYDKINFKPGRAVSSQDHLIFRLCYHTPIIHPTTLFKKKAFLSSLGYLQQERHAEDYGLWCRIIKHGKICGLQKPLLRYRLHPNSISKKVLDYQCQLGRSIAFNHARSVLSMNETELEKGYFFMSGESNQDLATAFWFIVNYYSKFNIFNFENNCWLFRKIGSLVFKYLKFSSK